MKCEDLLRMLREHVDGEIDPAICDQFEAQLAGCDPCQVVIDTVRRTITLYKNEQVYAMPIEFRERLHQTLRDRWRARQPGSDPRGAGGGQAGSVTGGRGPESV